MASYQYHPNRNGHSAATIVRIGASPTPAIASSSLANSGQQPLRRNGGVAPPMPTPSSKTYAPVGAVTNAQRYNYHAQSSPYPPQYQLHTPHSDAASIASTSSMTVDSVESECLEHYELNLEKYKDERDAIQKKTFTKWVNKHLAENGRRVDDLFRDLRDGFNLITLLEALTAEKLSRENGYTRFHRIQNVQTCLDFLRKRHIRLVNIRPEDIVEGNGKLTLGLIWTIILKFQVSVINQRLLLEEKREVLRTTTTKLTVNGAQRNGDVCPPATAPPATALETSYSSSGSSRKNGGAANHLAVPIERLGGGGGSDHYSSYHRRSGGGGSRYYDSAAGAWREDQQLRRREEEQRHLAHQQQQRQGFSESSAYEAREHYEKKVGASGGSKSGTTRRTHSEGLHRINANGGISASDGNLVESGERRVESHAGGGDVSSAREALLRWSRQISAGHPGVNITNFTSSWRDGLAFNAILHRYRPRAVDWNKISNSRVASQERLCHAFDAFHREFDISRLLDPEDVDVEKPDEKSILTYVSSLYNTLSLHDQEMRANESVVVKVCVEAQ